MMGETRDRVCHKKLTSERSVVLSLGPTCLRQFRFGSSGVQTEITEIGVDNLKELEGMCDAANTSRKSRRVLSEAR